jgi:hypothetical protein
VLDAGPAVWGWQDQYRTLARIGELVRERFRGGIRCLLSQVGYTFQPASRKLTTLEDLYRTPPRQTVPSQPRSTQRVNKRRVRIDQALMYWTRADNHRRIFRGSLPAVSRSCPSLAIELT